MQTSVSETVDDDLLYQKHTAQSVPLSVIALDVLMYCELDAVRLRHCVPVGGDDVLTHALLDNVASKLDPNVPSLIIVVPEVH